MSVLDIRSNGLSANTVGLALVFAQQVSESDTGLYTCSASWYHHNATVTVLVDITSQEIHSSEYLLPSLMMAIVHIDHYNVQWALEWVLYKIH